MKKASNIKPKEAIKPPPPPPPSPRIVINNRTLQILYPTKKLNLGQKGALENDVKEYENSNMEVDITVENNLHEWEFKGGIARTRRPTTTIVMRVSCSFKCPCCDKKLSLRFKDEKPYR